MWTWGRNDAGQLGDGTVLGGSNPRQIGSLASTVGLSGGQYHTLTLKSDGTVWASGFNEYGQLGAPSSESCLLDGVSRACSTRPLQVTNLADATAIASGGLFSVAIRGNDTVWAWGSNYYGQLGATSVATGTGAQSQTPVQVETLSDVTVLGAGRNHGLVDPPTPPEAWKMSYYVSTVDTSTSDNPAYQLGCALGDRDRLTPGTQDSASILAFGRPRFWGGQQGAVIYSEPASFATVTQIRGVIEQVARGYWLCAGADYTSQLRIIAGTSNYAYEENGVILDDNVTPDHARAWAQMVNEARANIEASGYSSQVQIHGGSDMELDWQTPQATRGWVDAYAAAAQGWLYNFGDASGCPPVAGDCGSARFPDWTQEDVYHISWGSPLSWPFPQIYYITDPNDPLSEINARQWYQMVLYSLDVHGKLMWIAGVLTQERACQQKEALGTPCEPELRNTPEQGYEQMWRWLNANDPRARQDIRYLSDIQYQ